MRATKITQNEEQKREKVTCEATECSRTNAQKIKLKFCIKNIAAEFRKPLGASKLYQKACMQPKPLIFFLKQRQNTSTDLIKKFGKLYTALITRKILTEKITEIVIPQNSI